MGTINVLRFDAVNANGRVRLAMPLFATIAFSAFILEDKNLLALALGHDLAVNRYPVYIGLADLDGLAVGK
jgi:hypothetical protein